MTNQVTETPSSPSNDTGNKKKRVVFIVVGVVLVAALATGAALFSQSLFSSAPPPAPPKAPGNAAAANGVPKDFTEFKDDKLGISLSYPASWARLKTDDPQILLLTSNGPDESFLLRATELQKEVGPQNLKEAKQLTDQIIGSNKGIQQVTEPKQLTLGGLPGFFYFYSFKDQASGQTGAHSHFFLFKGKTMLTLVFQTVPSEQFPNSAKTYDQITSSFKSFKK
jgi:hypothetical protein